MFFTRKLCLLIMLLATIYSCEKENFNYVLDEAIPNPPVIIKEETGVLRFSLNDNPLDTIQGFGVTDGGVYVISDDSVECDANGGFSSSGSFILIFIQSDGVGTVLSLAFSTEIDGENTNLFAEGSFFQCGRDRPTVAITAATEDFVSGTITGDFYTLDVEGNGECEEFYSYYGNLTVAFSVPVEFC